MNGTGQELGSVLKKAVSVLNDAGIDGAAADARILAAAAFGLSREGMLRDPDRWVTDGSVSGFVDWVARRAENEPVSRILGKREFRSLQFEIVPETLDPRPDSETVVDAVLEIARNMAPDLRILDIGTGSGCLLLSVLDELPDAQGIGTDIDAAAVACASRNAENLGLAGRARFVQTGWVDGISDSFDLVLSNPPYIRSSEIPTLAPEVSIYDPNTALDGGADGLDAYRALSRCIGRVLAPSGRVVLEIGAGQETDVEAIFAAAGYHFAGRRMDLAGRVRVLLYSRSPP